MKNLETNVVIKCDSLKQLKKARKKLIEMGYKEDKKWNDFFLSQLYNKYKKEYVEFMFYIIIYCDYDFHIHLHDGHCKTTKLFKEFFKLNLYGRKRNKRKATIPY